MPYRRVTGTLRAATSGCTGYGCVCYDDVPSGIVRRGTRWTSSLRYTGRSWRSGTHGLPHDSPLSALARPKGGAGCVNAHVRICPGARGDSGPYRYEGKEEKRRKDASRLSLGIPGTAGEGGDDGLQPEPCARWTLGILARI